MKRKISWLHTKTSIAAKCGVGAPSQRFSFVSQIEDASRGLGYPKQGVSLTSTRHDSLGILISTTNRDFSTGLTSASAVLVVSAGSPGTSENLLLSAERLVGFSGHSALAKRWHEAR